MIFAAIDRNSCEFYTYLDRVFEALQGKQRDYNWLITDSDILAHSDSLDRLNTRPTMVQKDGKWEPVPCPAYHFLSGDDLTEMVENDRCQWIWAVLSGFEKDVPLEKILEYPLPYADGYRGFWKNPPSIQHPLASVELVPWDSSLVLLFSKKKELADLFRAAFSESEDLETYNAK